MSEPIYKSGTKVFDPTNPGVIGTISIRSPKQTPAGWKYRIELPDGSHASKLETTLEEYCEQSNDIEELIKRGLYGRASDLRRNLTYRILSGNLAHVIYSLGVTNTDFYPHQFKPLLTLLDSPINGVLIADEVGLGKTIEAGLIWTELRAREDLTKLLVICPASLRDKWRDELSLRFGIDSKIVNTEELVGAIRSPGFRSHSDVALIASYEAISTPSKNKSSKGQKNKQELYDLLSQREFERTFDCVIFDEAHVMRNQASARWKGGSSLTNVSEYQLMLSATPINLKNEDLFNILNLLDPDNFAFHEDFEAIVEDNSKIIRARDKVMDTRTSIGEVLDLIIEAKKSDRFQYSSRLQSIEKELTNKPTELNKQSRVEIAESLEKISLLSHIVSRTRKKEAIAKKVTRKVNNVPVTLNKHERRLYELVTLAIQEYGVSRDINHGFLLSQPQRMVTSCPGVFASYLDPNNPKEDDTKPVKSFVRRRLSGKFDGEYLKKNDTKFAHLKLIVDSLNSEDNSDKLIIFSMFRATVDYIAAKLGEIGIEAMAVKGGDPRAKSELIARFQNSDSCRVLVCTEVLAEGVDLQFCNKMVNYDLPWNPTRIEQRIGRIDRLGQESDVIHIFNLYYEDTVDSRVIHRLYDRIGIFEEALGESEKVLGDELLRLQDYLYSSKRTREEEDAQIIASELAMEKIKRDREQLQKDSPHLITQGQALLDRIAASTQLSRAINEQDLVDYVQAYVKSQHGNSTFKRKSKSNYRYELKLPARMATEFKEFCGARELLFRTRLISGHSVDCEFNKELTVPSKINLEYINQFHPLIKFINQKIESQPEYSHPLVAVRLKTSENLSIPTGRYLFCVNSWYIPGSKKEESFAYGAVNIENGERLQSDQQEILVQQCRVGGEDWIDAAEIVTSGSIMDMLETVEDDMNAEFSTKKLYKQKENADRLREQKHGFERYYKRRKSNLVEQLDNQVGRNEQLVKMIKGKIKKLEERYEFRMAEIELLGQAEMMTTEVCVGVVDVYS